jgi:hypothetical protein
LAASAVQLPFSDYYSFSSAWKQVLPKESSRDTAFITEDFVLGLYFAALKDPSIVEIMEP